MKLFFDPLDSRCKSPTGAVREGTEVRFNVFADECEAELLLRLRSRFSDKQSTVALERRGTGFSAAYTFDAPDVLYYRFETPDGKVFADDGTLRAVAEGTDWFIQTVYSRDYAVPESFAGRVMYQIFPDSFAKSGDAKAGVPSDRQYLSTGDTPRWRPDKSGRYSNSYYGGDLAGIAQRLLYLHTLGVGVIYLNPIFEAHSNHRYNTADYMKIDPQLGSERDFVRLCEQAGALDIKIILDGVFSHTGDDSVYFDRCGRYNSGGAYTGKQSKYYNWYKFGKTPDDYKGWWGIKTLPETDETQPDYVNFICGENGVLRHWLRLGASGWRLDVADELPDGFIEKIRAAVKAENGALLIGEVWEDAVTKESYGEKRRYLLGKELDSVMNYPLRTAVLDFLRTSDCAELVRTVKSQLNEYPPQTLRVLMNMLSTHDTPRLITELSGRGDGMSMKQRSAFVLPRGEYMRALELAKLAYVLVFTMYGMPCVYYGDECGMQGFGDPFCRAFLSEDLTSAQLPGLISRLSALRGRQEFVRGDLRFLTQGGSCCAYTRSVYGECSLVAVNRGDTTAAVDFNGKSYEVPPWRWIIESV